MKRRPYPWRTERGLTHSEMQEVVVGTNRTTQPSGRIQAHGMAIHNLPFLTGSFFVIMTESEIQSDPVLNPNGAPEAPYPSGLHEGTTKGIDDGIPRTWCYRYTLDISSNIQGKRLKEPYLVYFPAIPVDQIGNQTDCGVTLSGNTNPGDITYAFWNHSSGRWESTVIPDPEKASVMDLVSVCGHLEPVDGCSVPNSRRPCCLWPGVAYRLLPTCPPEDFCAPNNTSFAVWVYSPGIWDLAQKDLDMCQWAKRIQDEYTVSWRPFATQEDPEKGPLIEDTRPIYQVESCTCSCPKDQVRLRFWTPNEWACEQGAVVASGYRQSEAIVPLRTETSPPWWQEGVNYKKWDVVKDSLDNPDGEFPMWYECLIDHLSIDGGDDDNRPISEGGIYWQELSWRENEQQQDPFPLYIYRAEFKMTWMVPQYGIAVSSGYNWDPEGESGPGFLPTDNESGEPFYDGYLKDTGNGCMGENGVFPDDGIPERSVAFFHGCNNMDYDRVPTEVWYRITIQCVPEAGGIVQTMLELLLHPRHYANTQSAEYLEAHTDELISIVNAPATILYNCGNTARGEIPTLRADVSPEDFQATPIYQNHIFGGDTMGPWSIGDNGVNCQGVVVHNHAHIYQLANCMPQGITLCDIVNGANYPYPPGFMEMIWNCSNIQSEPGIP